MYELEGKDNFESGSVKRTKELCSDFRNNLKKYQEISGFNPQEDSKEGLWGSLELIGIMLLML